jgi:hypothetical protein
MNARLRQLVGYRAADAAGPSGNQGCGRHGNLLVSFLIAAGLAAGLPENMMSKARVH